jgi:outer membrane lipoprotein LolB
MKLAIALLSLALLLAGCSSVPPRPQPADSQLAWQQHKQQVSALHSWRLTGRLGIQTGHEGWHASVDWQQRDSNYTIRITAPLGQGSLLLQGGAGGVLLQTSEGETLSAADPGLLLYQQLGWQVPVTSLRYWVLGLPAPGEAVETLDPYGRLSHLKQSGWEIAFLDYETQQGVELPGRVFVSNPQAKVRLVIGEWQLAPVPGGEEG